MKNLRLLVCAFTLTLSLGLTAPALAQSQCNPGEMVGPPCASVQSLTEDTTDSGVAETPPATDLFDLTSVVTDVLSVLTLF
jgi:hypothetical protein